MKDSIDAVVEQWRGVLPEAEVQPAAAIGRIHRISQIVQLQSIPILEQAGLGRGEFDVLALLMRSGRAMAPTEIALTLSASPAGTTKRVQKLLTAGLLSRKPHESDRRSALLETTPKARDMFPSLMRMITSMERDVLAVLAPGPKDALDEALRTLLIGLEPTPAEADE
jgi:DNA-binding MarR family transcriptional regulator